MPTTVFLLRHAESANPLVFHGAESDVGLSARGRRQAEALAPLLAALSPHAIVSSAMRRAVDTATPILAQGDDEQRGHQRAGARGGRAVAGGAAQRRAAGRGPGLATLRRSVGAT